MILVILKIAIIAYTLLNTNDLGLSLFGARSLNTLSTRPGYSHSDLTGAMCFLLYTNGDENRLECMARWISGPWSQAAVTLIVLVIISRSTDQACGSSVH